MPSIRDIALSSSEQERLWRAFDRIAFYDENGKGRFKPTIELKDCARVIIISDRGFAIDWWRDFIGLVIEAKLIFHQTLPTNPYEIHYLYEVIPYKINSNGLYVSGPIKAECIIVVDYID